MSTVAKRGCVLVAPWAFSIPFSWLKKLPSPVVDRLVPALLAPDPVAVAGFFFRPLDEVFRSYERNLECCPLLLRVERRTALESA